MNDKPLFVVADGTKTTSENSPAFDMGPNWRASVQATWDVTTPAAKTCPPGTASVQTLTYLSKALSADGDFAVMTDASGREWAVGLSKNQNARHTWTVLAKASCVEGDFLVFQDADGGYWAVAINKSGTGATPTSPAWTAVAEANKVHVDISSATTAAQVMALIETAVNALVGFSDAFTTDDTAANGTMIVDADAPGAIAAPTPHKIASGITAAGTGPGTSLVGVSTTAGYVTAEPTAAEWLAVDEDRRAFVDIDAETTNAEVAAACETALEALDDFDTAWTISTTGEVSEFTNVERGTCVEPAPFNADGSDVGTIVGAETTPGVMGVHLANNAFYTLNHGFATGLKVRLTTGTTLPAGLALATDYYIIRLSASTYSFAATYEDAIEGTAVDITDVGTGTHTVTAEALAASTKLQKSNDGTNWTDVHDDEVLGGSNSQTITADGSYVWTMPDISYKYLRQVLTLTGGQLTMSTLAVSK